MTARVRCGADDWCFVPVVLGEQFVGLAARRPPPDSSEFIEVFACQKLVPRLGLKDRDQMNLSSPPRRSVGAPRYTHPLRHAAGKHK